MIHEKKLRIWHGLSRKWKNALRGAVEKWIGIVEAGGHVDIEPECPCCAQLAGSVRDYLACQEGGCPIALYAHKDTCRGTPYVAWDRVADGWNRARECYAPARRELRFLVGFLPLTARLRRKAEKALE